MYYETTATTKINNLTKRIRAVSGGTSASKTISILIWLIAYAQTIPNKHISVVSETMPHLKKGAIKDFLDIMKTHHYFKDRQWNKSDKLYRFENESVIEFFSADTPDKVRGPRRDILFINEANNISYDTFDQLEIRTNNVIWMDWNPVNEFWFYLDEHNNPGVISRPDVDFITLTYKDNEALNDQIIKTIELRRNNTAWWRVYGEGLLGEAKGRIYTGWEFIDGVPDEARLEGYGLDFGYSNDPTAIVAVYRYNGGLLLDEVCYETGLSNRKIADILLNMPRVLTVADSAEPKSIDEIKSYGVLILPALKGEGSVNQGIQYLQDQKIFVTKSSLNIIREYRNYMWAIDKNDRTLNVPNDFMNHCFVGGTLIQTKKGSVPIKNVVIGDEVLTRFGFKKVLKWWDNGYKRVNKYSLQTDMGIIKLECTPNHKIYTNKGWIPISKLKSGLQVYLHKPLKKKNILYTQKKDTFLGVEKECTLSFGNTIMEKFLKICTFITRTKTLGITILKISCCYPKTNTFRNTQKLDLNKIKSGSKFSTKRELKQQRNGTAPKKVLNGTDTTELKLTKKENLLRVFVRCVGRLIKLETLKNQNTVILTAKLKHLDVEEGKKEIVYDLTVEDYPEFFANNLLVHNSMDAIRYGASRYFAGFKQPASFNLPDMDKIRASGKNTMWGGIPL